MYGTGQIRELIPACSHHHFLDRQLEGIMPLIDFLKTPLGRVDLGRGSSQLSIVLADDRPPNIISLHGELIRTADIGWER